MTKIAELKSVTMSDEQLLYLLTKSAGPWLRERIEAWYDAAQQDVEEQIDKAVELAEIAKEAEYEPYKEAWGTLFSVWEDEVADGRWPAPAPDDQTLIKAMTDDMINGARAIQLLRGNPSKADIKAFLKEIEQ